MWIFKKKELVPKHIHNFCISIGKYFKLYRTEYTNCFDEVRVYERVMCECGAYKDVLISSNEFLPSMYHSDNEEKSFINELKSKGIKEEYELNIETNTRSCRNDCFCG